jgi:CheY-like chemotaxis protein
LVGQCSVSSSRSLTRHIPVQIITLDEDRQHGLARGAFAFVTKPTTPEVVSDALARIKGYSGPAEALVEDNAAERRSISELLGHSDVKSSPRAGSDALRILRMEPCDCVVLDLKLTDMTGFGFSRSLKQTSR